VDTDIANRIPSATQLRMAYGQDATPLNRWDPSTSPARKASTQWSQPERRDQVTISAEARSQQDADAQRSRSQGNTTSA